MTTQQIMIELEKKGPASTKKIFLNHGVKEPLFGVKIRDLKVIQKKLKEITRSQWNCLQPATMMLCTSQDNCR